MVQTNYMAKCFPFQVGGGPGGVHELVFTVTCGAESNPVATVASKAAYVAASAANQAKHDRFDLICKQFNRYGVCVYAASDGNTKITLRYEGRDIYNDGAVNPVGIPDYVTKSHRKDAYELAQDLVGSNGITAITVTVDGAAQSS
jgi:hypothetical protein